MKNLPSKKLLYIAIFLLIASNVVILSVVGFNRFYKDPEFITLTNKELRMPYGLDINGANSGLSLRISYSSVSKERRYFNTPIWLDRAKLIELGFDLEKLEKHCNTDYRPQMPKKSVYLAFELNGKEYIKAIEQAKQRLSDIRLEYDSTNTPEDKRSKEVGASKNLENILDSHSRLYTIDANLDRAILKERYPDSSKYFITKAVVFPTYNCSPENKITQGHIDSLENDLLHVNSKLRNTLMKAWAGTPYEFKAKVGTGALGYMWLESIE